LEGACSRADDARLPFRSPAGDDPVFGHILIRHFLNPDDAGLDAVVHLQQLLQARLLGLHDVVAQHHGERLIPDERSRAPDGVAESFRFFLPNVVNVGHLRDRPQVLQRFQLAFLLERLFQFERLVEVVFDGPLPPAADDDDILDPRLNRFFNDVLDGRLVHDGEHFFRLGLGGRQEPGAEPGRGNHRFSHTLPHASSSSASIPNTVCNQPDRLSR
jgi:hypothetical protein